MEKVFLLNKYLNKGKFKARGIQGLFLGYSSTFKAYRIWVPDERKVVITRDVRFIHELKPDKYEDIVSGTITNGRFKVLDESLEDIKENETQIGPSVVSEINPEDLNESEDNHSMNEYLEDEDNNDFENTQVKRGPGRPRIIRTGRAGRPTK